MAASALMAMARLAASAAILCLVTASNVSNVSHSNISMSNASNVSVSKGSKERSGLKVRLLDTVTILHVSDTHSLHRSTGDLPSADIFIHSGDVAKVGSDGELGDFNDWLGTIKHKYQHMCHGKTSCLWLGTVMNPFIWNLGNHCKGFL